MERHPFGQALATEDGRFTHVNQVLCAMLGLDREALLRRGILDITHPGDWPANNEKLNRLRAVNEPFSIVKRYLRADGSIVWVQSYVSMLEDAQGQRSLSALIRPVLEQEGESLRQGGEKPAPLSRAGKEALLRPRILQRVH